MRTLITIAALVLAIPAVGGEMDHQTELQTLLDVDRAFARATEERGLDGWLSFFADDATIFPNTTGIISGIDEIVAHYRATGFSPQALRWVPVGGDVASSGDLGFTYGAWTFTIPADDSTPVKRTGKYLSVWRKNKAGDWKLIADIGSPDTPGQ